ncbi:STAS domain-containing protein [Saccharopolyspora rectivirgula]|jgi:anti-sigma B factor antagonist|uniref:STAS domain-containing protein n=2 Tax=Saccharopolyspora rectivirgula TaxID=28042 RepID=UPI0009DDCCFD|nr:STAS domain-containing protein [Saccharopolyspora rectivirgula]
MSQDEVGSQTPAPRTNAHQPADMLRARTYQPAPHVEVIEVGGVLDLNSAPQFADIVRDQMATPCRTLVLDLSGLTFLSTHGVVSLLEAGHRALMGEVQLVLVSGNRIVDRLLEMLDVADRFTYADSVSDAVAARRELPRLAAPT